MGDVDLQPWKIIEHASERQAGKCERLLICISWSPAEVIRVSRTRCTLWYSHRKRMHEQHLPECFDLFVYWPKILIVKFATGDVVTPDHDCLRPDFHCVVELVQT